MEFFLHGKKNVRNILDMDNIAVGVEHLDEPAHVRALEFFRQIDKHADGGHGVLHRSRLVPDLDWKPEASHADFINAQLAVIALALFVVQTETLRRV